MRKIILAVVAAAIAGAPLATVAEAEGTTTDRTTRWASTRP